MLKVSFSDRTHSCSKPLKSIFSARDYRKEKRNKKKRKNFSVLLSVHALWSDARNHLVSKDQQQAMWIEMPNGLEMVWPRLALEESGGTRRNAEKRKSSLQLLHTHTHTQTTLAYPFVSYLFDSRLLYLFSFSFLFGTRSLHTKRLMTIQFYCLDIYESGLLIS